jgi:glucosamine 6-phosphate synthetase-like amidotransferase/phosphosugar isomerase protein
MRRKKSIEFLEQLREIPNILSQLLKDEKVKKFCEKISSESRKSCANFVIDALSTTGVGYEAAAKLEECSWSSIAKPIDYNDLYIQCLRKDLEYNLILVNTTHKPRLSEAISIMNKLYLEKIPFVGVSTSIRELAKVEMFSQNRCICLPSADPAFQPFVDFVFFYMLSFYYGRAHGRSCDFPRNRAKSVTAGRNLLSEPTSMQKSSINWISKFVESGLRKKCPTWLLEETIWETTSEKYWEKSYFRQMRELIRIIQEKCH